MGWDGSGLGVVWSDERLGSDLSGSGSRAPADAVPDRRARCADRRPGVSREPRLAWTGPRGPWRDRLATPRPRARADPACALDAAGVVAGSPVPLTTEARARTISRSSGTAGGSPSPGRTPVPASTGSSCASWMPRERRSERPLTTATAGADVLRRMGRVRMDGGVGAGGDGGNRNRRRVVPAVGNAGGGETVVGPGVAGDAQRPWPGTAPATGWPGSATMPAPRRSSSPWSAALRRRRIVLADVGGAGDGAQPPKSEALSPVSCAEAASRAGGRLDR